MNMIKYFKKSKNLEETFNYNPIFDDNKERFNIKEYLKIKEIDINNIIDSECFICYEKFSDCKKICLPYKCNHIICYKCFCKYCHSLRRSGEIDITHRVFCPMCRKSVNEEWRYSKKMYFFKDKIENNEIEFVFPVSISDVYYTSAI